ncbi:hypothetical protein GFJ94_07010 [Flavobacterium sp. LMO8]|uniref:hypothetical protein n=1 Tax=Flavobacterium sp. LMO8 TaxID=2654244 RepID=UPI001290BF6F|nr:hypothetical protein [Flavobacterium sp. LMO8]MQP24812.1 hypothetical protein [Flavobacterium sp. LMO8]
MKKFKIYTAGLLLLALNFTSCNKEEDFSVDKELVNASADIDLTNELDFNSGIDVSSDNSSYSERSSNQTNAVAPCASVSVNNSTPGVFPKVFTVDFGTGCTYNGLTRSGIITITITDYVMNNGSIMTIERGNNYYVNGRKVEGTVVYENTTTNPDIPQWTRTITNGKITNLQGIVFNHNGTRTVKQTAGVSTLILADNIYEITSGNHTITRVGGSSLSVTVVETLIKKYACSHISQGQLDLQGSVLDGILDYGNNTCDNLATYTHSNGTVYNVTLY